MNAISKLVTNSTPSTIMDSVAAVIPVIALTPLVRLPIHYDDDDDDARIIFNYFQEVENRGFSKKEAVFGPSRHRIART